MNEIDIKKVVEITLAAEREEQDKVIEKAVITVLARFGIEEDDHKEVKADFIHLRKWRKSVEQAQGLTFKAIVSVIVTGIIGAVWLGIQTKFGIGK